jgi:Cu(I)/Ag(I) efflux system membrane protein CusA/SilA
VRGNDLDAVADKLAPEFGPDLAAAPLQDDVNKLIQQIAEQLAAQKHVELNSDLYALKHNWLKEALLDVGDVLGAERSTLFTEMFAYIDNHRNELWGEHLKKLNYELIDQAAGAFDWYCLEEIRKEALNQGLWKGGRELSADEAKLKDLRAELDPPFAKKLLLWRKIKEDLGKEMDAVMQMPGWGNIWTQPIINRINMLATGIRTMLGVKIYGNDSAKIYRVAEDIDAELKKIPGAVDVTLEQTHGKGYLEIDIDRQKAARYGVNVGDIQDVIEVALGGKAVTMTVEGRERFPVRLRYARAWRDDEEQVKNLLVSAGSTGMATGTSGMNAGGAGGMNGQSPAAKNGTEKSVPMQIPLSAVADVRIVEGPSMIRSENGMLCSYVFLNVRDRDIMSLVEEAQRVLEQKIKPNLPPGMYYEFSGQFEHQIRARKTLQVVFPAVILLIFIILYLTYNDLMDAVLMMMAVPEALVGGIFFLWLFNYNFSVAVWVGFIACFGMATETGIIMLVYLREALEKRGGLEKIGSLAELRQAILEGAVHRLRPKLLTEGVAIIALAPMLWASGVGHEVISAMAAPVLGGLLVSDEVVDIFIPVRFYWVRRARWLKLHPEKINEA